MIYTRYDDACQVAQRKANERREPHVLRPGTKYGYNVEGFMRGTKYPPASEIFYPKQEAKHG